MTAQSEGEHNGNSSFVPVPKTCTIVHDGVSAQLLDKVLAILDETAGFASLSHGARENLNEATDILEGMRSSVASPAFLKRIEALEAENAVWQPIETCPFRDEVDLWCVYGGEEFAQYDGGASIGKLVPKRFKTVEYGFFGNQSNDGVPQGHAPDLVPVAWRNSVPQCPPELIAKVLGIPLTREAARTALTQGQTHADDGASIVTRKETP